MGVEPDSGGRARESLDQESVEREDVQQESAKAAGSQLAGARLPLEAGSVVLGEDGHIQSAPANRPLAFRFAACGVQFEAEIAGRTAPLCLRANLGKLPYSAESPEARSLARVVLGASGRRSEEHTSELQSLMRISSAVFCLTKKKKATT